MELENLTFGECADLLFDLAAKTYDFWDDKAAEDYRELMKNEEKEMKSIVRGEK